MKEECPLKKSFMVIPGQTTLIGTDKRNCAEQYRISSLDMQVYVSVVSTV